MASPEFDLERFERALGVPEFDLERLKRVLGVPEFDLESLKRALGVPYDLEGAREGLLTSQHSILERLKSCISAPELDARAAQECKLASQNSILICSRGPLASHMSILRDSQRALGVPEFDLETFKRALGGVPEVDLERFKRVLDVPKFDESSSRPRIRYPEAQEASWRPTLRVSDDSIGL